MKKSFVFILPMVLCMISCASKQVMKKTYNYTYTNVTFEPTEQIGGISNDVNLTVDPIDAKKIDQEFFEFINRSGSYEKDYLDYKSYIQQERKLTLQEKTQIKTLENYYQLIDKLISTNEISEQVGFYFKEHVYNWIVANQKYGLDGSEINLVVKNDAYSNLNPYKIGLNHLSLFKLSFSNRSKKTQNISIEDFQIENNETILYPYNNQFFETFFITENDDLRKDKLKYIHKANMPNVLRLLPNQSITKYVSIPAIEPKGVLTLSYVKDNNVIDYSFNVKSETYTEEQNFSAYMFTYIINSYNPYVVIELEDGTIFPLSQQTLYVNDKKIHETIKVYALGLIGSIGGRFGFVKESFKPSQVSNNKIKLTPKRIPK